MASSLFGSQNQTPSTPSDMERSLAAELPEVAIHALLRAAQYALEADCPPWDFALDVRQLRRLGLTDCDLRWLCCKGLLDCRSNGSSPTALNPTLLPNANVKLGPIASCILTPRGFGLFQEIVCGVDLPRANQFEIGVEMAIGRPTNPLTTPIWDRERRELRLGPTIIKHFSVPAENQQQVLTAFQEEDWPTRIDDPLPSSLDLDRKRRLHSTIQSLNRNQIVRLVNFRGDGTGNGVHWQILSLEANLKYLGS